MLLVVEPVVGVQMEIGARIKRWIGPLRLRPVGLKSQAKKGPEAGITTGTPGATGIPVAFPASSQPPMKPLGA